MINKINDLKKNKIVLDSKQDLGSENRSEIVMTKAENISEIKIENKKIYSVSLPTRNQVGTDDTKTKRSKLNFSASNKAEIQIKKTFQTLTKENNIIEWKAFQPKEIKVLC